MAKVQFPLGGMVSLNTSDFIPAVTGSGADLFVVSKNRGSNDNDGKALDTPLRTIQKAIDLATDNRLTVIRVEPGEYAEAVNVNKRRIALIGDPRNAGITVIGHNGTTTRASVYVGDGFLNGFTMANLSVTTAIVGATEQARPCIHLVTDDTAANAGAEAADYHFYLENVHCAGDGVAIAGLYLEGATLGVVNGGSYAGLDIGIAFGGSLNNFPVDIQFNGPTTFYNNVRADVATVTPALQNAGRHPSSFNIAALGALSDVFFIRSMFMDRGGTPVTNYVNMIVNTAVNVGFYDFYAARDVADGTLMQLPVDVIALGQSAAGVESIIGA